MDNITETRRIQYKNHILKGSYVKKKILKHHDATCQRLVIYWMSKNTSSPKKDYRTEAEQVSFIQHSKLQPLINSFLFSL